MCVCVFVYYLFLLSVSVCINNNMLQFYSKIFWKLFVASELSSSIRVSFSTSNTTFTYGECVVQFLLCSFCFLFVFLKWLSQNESGRIRFYLEKSAIYRNKKCRISTFYFHSHSFKFMFDSVCFGSKAFQIQNVCVFYWEGSWRRVNCVSIGVCVWKCERGRRKDLIHIRVKLLSIYVVVK